MKECKQCGVKKELQEFYSHPWTKDRKLPRCKQCILEWRKTEEEKLLARARDKKRDKEPDRKLQKKKILYKFRSENPEKWKAEQMVSNFLRYHKEQKPKVSAVSWEWWRIHLHHPDYSRPNEVIPCTPKEHRAFHSGTLKEKEEYIKIFPF